MRTFLFLFLFSFFIFAESDEHYVEFVKSKPIKIISDKENVFKLSFKVKEGYHVQANPVSEPNLIATTLKFEDTPGIEIKKVQYPKAIPFKMATKTLLCYEKNFDIGVFCVRLIKIKKANLKQP